MEKYNEYKDSGVQWLGEIPSHWKTVPFKSIFCLTKGLSITKANLVDEGVNVISYGQIHSKQNKSIRIVPELYRKVSKEYLGVSPQSLCNKEDFLIADTSEDIIGSGNFVRVDEEQLLFAGYHTIIARNKKPENSEFLAYLMLSDRWRVQIWIQVHGVKLYSISRGILNATKFLLPSIEEQHSIVSYLDTKCSKLDTFISNKEKEITLLQEMKQRVIADAIIRGLNPNVKFKPTNISWLPEIPENWEMVRNKSFMKPTEEKVGKRRDLTLLSLTKQGVIVRDLTEGKGKFPKDFESYLVVKPNNLVFCLFDIDETPRTVGLVHNDGMLTGAYSNFEIDERIVLPEFAYYYYLQVDNIKGLRPYYTGLRKVVRVNTFSMLRIPVPPIEEQHAIVSYITERVAKIDSLVEKLNKEIECIKEYKQRLISDVVTGQIKVS